MTLNELIAHHEQPRGRKARPGVPDWMPGFWKRYSISFANGQTDLHTHVCWVQSRNFTIDLRLPQEKDQVPARALNDYSPGELQVLADYEGWKAPSIWDGNQLSWGDTEATLQLHNRWPEPAVLWRTGNCMIEHCPSNIYVEDWRLQSSAPGALVGLHLIEEREVSSGKLRHCGGGLIVCGDYAALTLGRVEQPASGKPLKTRVAEAGQDMQQLEALFNFETSVAIAGPDGSYQIMLSTRPARVGTEIFPLTGFEVLADQRVRQTLVLDGLACERIFEIDTIERTVAYAQATPATEAAQAWFDTEVPTLGRYLETLS